MNQVPIRLGPLALLLTIISICLTMLSILTYTTSGADLRLAEKYADTVRSRYELETEGQAYLQAVEDAVLAGFPLEEAADRFTDSAANTSGIAFSAVAAVPGGGVSRTFEKDGTVLTVQLAVAEEGKADAAEGRGTEKTGPADAPRPEASSETARGRRVRVVEWKIVRQWEEDSNIGNIWMPEQ